MFVLGFVRSIILDIFYKLKTSGKDDESMQLTKVKDKKFLEGLAQDKRYLEQIVSRLSATTPGSNIRSSATRSMISEVI